MSGCSKNVGKERKVKTPVGKKCPLKTVALLVDEKEKAIESSQGRLRADGDLHQSEKPGWNAGDMEK